jgi:predicted Zn-dependent protease
MTIRTTSVALLGALALAGCAYNEDLGRSQLLLVDNAALATAANEAWATTLRTEKVSTNPALTTRLRQVGQRLVTAAGLADRPWQYVVFDDATANAFVLPGGQIGVNTGLLSMVENDDQLAAVIGHEIAHMTAQHAAERYSQNAATQLLAAAAGTALAGGNADRAKGIASLGGVGAQLGVLLPFSRRHELEADRLGVDYMVRAGYRAGEAVKLWANMAAGRTGGGGAGGFMSTHPSDAQRIEALRAHIMMRGYG